MPSRSLFQAGVQHTVRRHAFDIVKSCGKFLRPPRFGNAHRIYSAIVVGRVPAISFASIILLPLTLTVIWLAAAEPSAQQPPANLAWISIPGNQPPGLSWRAEFQMGCVPGTAHARVTRSRVIG